MKPWLYLDTARLGRMSPAAQRAQVDFARMAGEMGGAIQLEDLLRHGFEACSSSLQRRFPGIASWHGVDSLKNSLRRLAGLEKDLPVLLAARSAELMKFAAVLLCRWCRNTLTTDLGWPPYHRILEGECKRTQRRVTSVTLSDDILHGRVNADEVVDRISSEFIRSRCDGLFLTAVNNLGARLPVKQIARAVGKRCRFILVDGAQDFCHVGADIPPKSCDLYLAGCHKWLGGYHPLGIAVYGRARTRKFIESVLNELLHYWQLGDPLLRFVEHLHEVRNCDPGETVNLSSLFSSAGAVQDATNGASNCEQLHHRLENADQVAELAAVAGWRPRLPDPTLRSGILTLEAVTEKAKELPAEECRASFNEHGVALTAYEGGLLRLSMPSEPLTPPELCCIGGALSAHA